MKFKIIVFLLSGLLLIASTTKAEAFNAGELTTYLSRIGPDIGKNYDFSADTSQLSPACESTFGANEQIALELEELGLQSQANRLWALNTAILNAGTIHHYVVFETEYKSIIFNTFPLQEFSANPSEINTLIVSVVLTTLKALYCSWGLAPSSS